MDAAQLKELLHLADQKDVFFSTNFWTRLFPAYKFLREAVKKGMIGDILLVRGDFAFVSSSDSHDRIVNKTMGGGGLLDIGCYEIQYATMLFDGTMPTQIQAVGSLNKWGVDNNAAAVMYWENHHGIASLTWSVARQGWTNTVEIFGSKGHIAISAPLNAPVHVVLAVDGGETIHYDNEVPALPEQQMYPAVAGFKYSIAAVEKAIAEGKKSLEETSRQDQMSVMRIADKIREQLGVTWDYEEKKPTK